jgi:hypothetical protein
MARGINFYCSPRDELSLLERLLRESRVSLLRPPPKGSDELRPLTLNDVPEWPERFDCLLWLTSEGPIYWHRSTPSGDLSTHNRTVATVIAHEEWSAIPDGPDKAMIDTERSPILVYRRSQLRDGRMNYCKLYSAVSSSARISATYDKWVTSCFSWIRRHAVCVHSYKAINKTLPGHDWLASSVHAFPEAAVELSSPDHRYAIFLHR